MGEQMGASLVLDGQVGERRTGLVAQGSTSRMSSRILRVREIGADDESAWRDLAERAAEPNPFYEPDCLIPAANHQVFGNDIRLAIAELDGRFYGCVPFREVKRWKFPYPVLTSQVRRMNGLGTPLIDPEMGADAATALLGALAGERSLLHRRIFVLDTSGAGGPVALYLREATQKARVLALRVPDIRPRITGAKRRAGVREDCQLQVTP